MFDSEEHVREIETMTPLAAYKAGWDANEMRYHFDDVLLTLLPIVVIAGVFGALIFVRTH